MFFFVLEKDYSRKKKRTHYCHYSESSDEPDVCEIQTVKRRRLESPSEDSEVSESSKGQSLQTTMTQFVQADTCEAFNIEVDTVIEIYRYGYQKKSGTRNTVVKLTDKHKNMITLKNDLKKQYGLTTDARRHQIGEFNVDIGVSCTEKAYMATTQTEWQNFMPRLYSGSRGTGQYCLLGE